MRKLTVRFDEDQDLVYGIPDDIRWNDGRPGTREDYARHRADTRALVRTAEGVELRLYPDVTADVRFDAFSRLWFVVPEGHEPISLDLRRPDATNLDLRAALYRLPVVYAVRIYR